MILTTPFIYNAKSVSDLRALVTLASSPDEVNIEPVAFQGLQLATKKAPNKGA